MNKKTLSILSISLIAIIIIAFAYRFYEDRSRVAVLAPYMKNASIRLDRIFRIEEEKGVTYREVLDRCESDLKELDQKLIELQTLSPSPAKEETAFSIQYLQEAKSLVRRFEAVSRKELQSNTAIESFRSLAREHWNSENYSAWAMRSLDRSKDEADKAVKEQIEAYDDLSQEVRQFKNLVRNRPSGIAEETLVNRNLIQKLVDAADAREAKKSAKAQK